MRSAKMMIRLSHISRSTSPQTQGIRLLVKLTVFFWRDTDSAVRGPNFRWFRHDYFAMLKHIASRRRFSAWPHGAWSGICTKYRVLPKLASIFRSDKTASAGGEKRYEIMQHVNKFLFMEGFALMAANMVNNNIKGDVCYAENFSEEPHHG
jgi:hypothetical protein